MKFVDYVADVKINIPHCWDRRVGGGGGDVRGFKQSCLAPVILLLFCFAPLLVREVGHVL